MPPCRRLFSKHSPSAASTTGFFHPIKELSIRMLAMLTRIDHDRDLALVALGHDENPGAMPGMGRNISDPDATRAEFAVLVGDPRQG